MDETLHQSLMDRLEGGRLPCAQAFSVAKALGLGPAAIGAAANEAGIRISHCQLGLFGYGPKAENRHKILRPMEEVPAALQAALTAEARSGGIPCQVVWLVADRLGTSRLQAASAVEALGLRVSSCQLGCFPRPKRGQ